MYFMVTQIALLFWMKYISRKDGDHQWGGADTHEPSFANQRSQSEFT
jgi:hypothetical protein